MDLDTFIESGFANLSIIEDQYAKYRRTKESVGPTWRKLFEAWDSFPIQKKASETEKISSPIQLSPPPQTSIIYQTKKEAPALPDIRIYNLMEGYRTHGHLMAKINPIMTQDKEEPAELRIETYGFTKSDLANVYSTFGLLPENTAPLLKIVNTLKSIYCDKIGVEYMGLRNLEFEQWLQKKIEPNHFKPVIPIEEKQMILQQLNKSELLESFLHVKYVGQKRFSLEGGETLIPMLSATIETGARQGMEEFVIGMAHRGRLNVLANILNKAYAEIFAEFDESYFPETLGSGDVKYHKGFYAEVPTTSGKKVKVDLPPNPSHLEAVDPVVEGMTRAKQVMIGDDILQEKLMPILIHGDAAIAGQGVVYETMQLYRLEGYSTGGTIHIVINNQIGFTTLPKDTRSTLYCTDIAKAFGAPVFHVNAEDPEGCVCVSNLAVEIRQKFHCDVFIDLNCYRKYGHNETDEPAFTQPLEYKIIRKKKPIREIYRDELIHQGVVEKFLAESLETEFKKSLQQALKNIKIPEKKKTEESEEGSSDDKNQIDFEPIETAVSKEGLQEAAERFSTIPEGFDIHPKLANLVPERLLMVKEGAESKPIDWGMAETLAYATLLMESYSVRISGQDCCRGTFSHRHAMWMDQKEEKAYYPLKHLRKSQGRFDIYNSPLSENAVLGFEFGYSLSDPNTLVIWEAQFGDFANGGQVVIDQFVVPAEQKWGIRSSLVLYLPHGYEGQGPEHSSGRIERFLSMAGHSNIRVVNPTTPAQFFHLLRRQMLNQVKKPLVIFTPKGLLRHPECVSHLSDLTHGGFKEVIDDPTHPAHVKKLIFCSGRIYYDITAERAKLLAKDVAVVRIEQLYPLHLEKLKEIIEQYEGFKEVIWAQEEPFNMGAWSYIGSQLLELLPKGKELKYVGRSRSAATAVGSHVVHKKELSAILNALFSRYEIRMPSQETGIKS